MTSSDATRPEESTLEALRQAIAARTTPADKTARRALRLFDGYREAGVSATVELFDKTIVVLDHRPAVANEAWGRELALAAHAALPFTDTALVKVRSPAAEGMTGARKDELSHGVVVLGAEDSLARRIDEHGVRYAVRLLFGKDASFYVDTGVLRRYLKERCTGEKVLNAFAHTGSLGVAARASARHVVHVDKNGAALNIAKDSYALNGFEVKRPCFIGEDFFVYAARARREGALYNTVILDPPFFAESSRGTVDMENGVERLVDKARPLVGDGGRLIVVNNGLFVSGAAFKAALEKVGGDGYLEIEELVGVPDDCLVTSTSGKPLPADPAPFVHPTKIAVLRVKRRDGRKA
ncbi:MAG: class I SAM-dependent methyltransferase [Polyangiaceae bacterium]